MSMCHKAYLFDWRAFQSELAPLLWKSLTDNDAAPLMRFIGAHWVVLVDPYEGEPLESHWADQLDVRDVHVIADFALTKYYDPRQDYGIGDAWFRIERSLAEAQKAALLGLAFGPTQNHFDPGRMGAYFQDDDECRRSWHLLFSVRDSAMNGFVALLHDAAESSNGIYVTF